MFFDADFGFGLIFDRDGDGSLDIAELSEAAYSYDVIMGTNITGMCPENDEDDDEDY